MGQAALRRALTSVFKPLFLYLFYSIHFMSHTNPPCMHTRQISDATEEAAEMTNITAASFAYACHFPSSNGVPLTNQRLTLDPHRIHHDTTTLTMITTNAFQKSPQQPTPDLFTTNSTTATTTPTSSPQSLQPFSTLQ